MALLRKLRSFLGLSWQERRQVLAALVLLPAVSLGLRFAGYARCRQWLDRRSPRGGAAPGDFERARRLARAVNVAAGNVPCRAQCLERSLTLLWMLRRRGLAGELRIGVQKADDELSAHAWVEIDGRAVNDSDDVGERFAAFEGLAELEAR